MCVLCESVCELEDCLGVSPLLTFPGRGHIHSELETVDGPYDLFAGAGDQLPLSLATAALL